MAAQQWRFARVSSTVVAEHGVLWRIISSSAEAASKGKKTGGAINACNLHQFQYPFQDLDGWRKVFRHYQQHVDGDKKHWWPSSFHCTSFWMVTNVFVTTHHLWMMTEDLLSPSKSWNRYWNWCGLRAFFPHKESQLALSKDFIIHLICLRKQKSCLFLKSLTKCRSCSLKLYHSITRFYFKTPSHLK